MPGLPGTLGDTSTTTASFFGGPGAHLGIGIQDYLLQIHGGIPSDDIAFGYGTSAAMTEVMRIKGTGNVGIGTNTVPVGGSTVGSCKLAIHGTESSELGPHVQFTTTLYSHPIVQLLNWRSNDIEWMFGGYYDKNQTNDYKEQS